jgi:Domain of Unknown Function (DUF748)
VKRTWSIIGIVLALFIAGIFIAVSLIDEPLRRYIERQANEKLEGYELSIAGLDLHPVGFSIDLEGVVLTRTMGGNLRLLEVPHWTASVHWTDLLRGNVVSDHDMQGPIIQLPNTTEERAEKKLKAWQDTATSVYPLTINHLVIRDGRLLYGGKGGEPIRLEHIDVEAGNIRNVESKSGDHPSELHVSGQLSEQGHMQMDGHADFFAKPNPAFDVELRLQRVELKHLLPVIGRYNVQLRSGALDMSGRMQHSSHATVLAIDTFVLDDAKIDYVHAAATKDIERTRVKKGAERAKEAHRNPAVLLKVGHGKILNSEMGFVNKAASPDYRVFISDMNVDLDSMSNRLEEGTGVVKMTGKFMGSGPTVMIGTFRPEKPRPDFNLEVKIIKTQVKSFNNLLRAHGDVDTMSGTFAFFSELSVKNNRIDGYVKPFLKDVEVYDPSQDKDKALTHKVYEAVIGGVLGLFENTPRDEVATVTDVSGPVDDPEAKTWQIVGKLVQNAFFEAILPGFEGRTG